MEFVLLVKEAMFCELHWNLRDLQWHAVIKVIVVLKG